MSDNELLAVAASGQFLGGCDVADLRYGEADV
jgi:hypothetical protein